MTNDIALFLVRLNLSLSIAVVVVLLLRLPFRRWCGADLAYRLWALVPFVVIGDVGFSIAAAFQGDPSEMLLAGRDIPILPAWAPKVWLSGLAAGLILMMATHFLAIHRVGSGKAGPAIVGLIRPRLCLPLDFNTRFTPPEQRLVRAHERMHLERNDVLANAHMGLVRCIFWFNPLIHMAAVALRHDQEMACDEGVMETYPDQRRRYASTLLKAQLGPEGVSGFGSHPLEARISAVVRGEPMAHTRVIGGVLLTAGFFILLGVYASSFTGDGPAGDIVHELRVGSLTTGSVTSMQLAPEKRP